jgi:hypothetical protein
MKALRVDDAVAELARALSKPCIFATWHLGDGGVEDVLSDAPWYNAGYQAPSHNGLDLSQYELFTAAVSVETDHDRTTLSVADNLMRCD